MHYNEEKDRFLISVTISVNGTLTLTGDVTLMGSTDVTLDLKRQQFKKAR